MTQNDANFERDLSDTFAPVKMPAGLQQRLLQLPQLHAQRPASWLSRVLPRRWLDGLALVSARPAFGMTTGVAAACCSLVIGLSLGLGGFAPVPTTQGTIVASNTASVTTTASTTGSGESDAVSLVYAAADLPGDLP